MNLQVPPQSTRTLCELQGRFVDVASSRAVLTGPACPDANLAPNSSGGIGGVAQGAGYAPIVKCPSGQWPPSYIADDGCFDSASTGSGGWAGLRPLLRQLARRLPQGAAARLERLLGLQGCTAVGRPLAWHPRQPLLAAVDGADRVHVFDYTRHLPLLGQGAQGGVPPPPPLQPLLLLQHEFQQGASAAAWRPHGGRSLAVGVAHGVCLWHIGRPPPGSGSRSDSGAWMTWLRAPGAGPVTTLSWHPQGHLLAAAGPDAAGFHVWDVATGTATPVSAGPEPAALLRWSPCGTYLLAAYPGGDFRIWETQTWWSQRWAASEGSAGAAGGRSGGRIVEACWGPDCRSLLLAYDSSPQLVSLHFTGEPPSLQAQLLPLPLAELSAKGSRAAGGTAYDDTSADAGPRASGSLVQAMAWDSRAQRLAVAVGGTHPAAGCVALYETRCDPILSARFIGFMRLGPLQPGAAAPGARQAAAAAEGWEEIQPEEVAEAAAEDGGRSGGASRGSAGAAAAASAAAAAARRSGAAALGAAPSSPDLPQLAFLPGFAQGAVLAARAGSLVAAVPMYFAA